MLRDSRRLLQLRPFLIHCCRRLATEARSTTDSDWKHRHRRLEAPTAVAGSSDNGIALSPGDGAATGLPSVALLRPVAGGATIRLWICILGINFLQQLVS
jgi:hypothetical protein